MSKPVLRPLFLFLVLAAAAPAASAGDLHLGVVLGEKGGLSLRLGDRRHHPHVHAVKSCALHARCAPARVWVPGHFETVERRVWTPERREKVWVDPVYETRLDPCGRPFTVLVREGRWTSVVTPGHYATVCDRAWVPGRYETRCKTY